MKGSETGDATRRRRQFVKCRDKNTTKQKYWDEGKIYPNPMRKKARQVWEAKQIIPSKKRNRGKKKRLRESGQEAEMRSLLYELRGEICSRLT